VDGGYFGPFGLITTLFFPKKNDIVSITRQLVTECTFFVKILCILTSSVRLGPIKGRMHGHDIWPRFAEILFVTFLSLNYFLRARNQLNNTKF